jgi:hypothetical protein
MKRIKFVCLTLAICFAAFSSFKSRQPAETTTSTGLLFRWYQYNGMGDPYEPESYTLLSAAPECHSDGNLCAVYSLTELLNNDHPSALGLLDLGLSSCTFTQPYTGLLGKVRLTHE